MGIRTVFVYALVSIGVSMAVYSFAYQPREVYRLGEGEARQAEQKPQSGDIIFQTSLSAQSKAIQLATHSRYSHCGVIYQQGNDLFVLEAVQPVKVTPYLQWIQRGEKSHYVVKRLKEANLLLTPEASRRLMQVGNRLKGKPYDFYFEWTDDRIYCSELIWKMYKEALNLELGALQPLRSFDLSSPAVRQKLKERYGNKIPYDEKVISPESVFNSDQLITVIEQ